MRWGSTCHWPRRVGQGQICICGCGQLIERGRRRGTQLRQACKTEWHRRQRNYYNSTPAGKQAVWRNNHSPGRAEAKREYASSPKGKIKQNELYERTREKRREQGRAWARRHWSPSVKTCESALCSNRFVRLRGSKQSLCDECFLIEHGPAKLRERKRRHAKMMQDHLKRWGLTNDQQPASGAAA